MANNQYVPVSKKLKRRLRQKQNDGGVKIKCRFKDRSGQYHYAVKNLTFKESSQLFDAILNQ